MNKVSFIINQVSKSVDLSKVIEVLLITEKEIKIVKSDFLGFNLILMCIIGGIIGLLIDSNTPTLIFIGIVGGSILGYLFTPSQQKDLIKKIGLSLKIQDTDMPTVIPISDLNTAKHWEEKIRVAITNSHDKLEREKNTNLIADELTKLHQLMLEGVISADEFQTQKNKLIS